jgi:hypothetical protein
MARVRKERFKVPGLRFKVLVRFNVQDLRFKVSDAAVLR